MGPGREKRDCAGGGLDTQAILARAAIGGEGPGTNA
jgi:hypothetical protein